MSDELQDLLTETAEKRRTLEERHTWLIDRLKQLRAGKESAAVTGSGIFVATRQVTEVLDVGRICRTTLNPGDRVARLNVNASKFGDRRVVYCTDEQLKALLADNAIKPAN
jgi:hypothetical protein